MSERTLDSDGIERVPNEWGFNSFATAEGAEQSARHLYRTGITWFIWELPDGTFDFSAIEQCGVPGSRLVKRADSR